MLSRETIHKAIPLALKDTALPLGPRHHGKVRDWYDLPGGKRLLVATDRLSAFDRILGQVPYKGQVLTQLSVWWFNRTCDLIDNHVLAVPDPNVTIIQVCKPILIEVVVRGYITGVTGTALWHRYSLGERHIYGYTFPDGLCKNAALPEPIITPTTKGGPGSHDEPLTSAEVVQRGLLDAATWDRVQMAAFALFRRGQAIAQKAGLILVDTKYEFGCAPDGRIMLIDEIHTPDSSRFWKASSYAERCAAGEEPENFDKEFIRLWYVARGYRGDGDPFPMPDDLVVAASQRYIAIYEMLTGRTFEPAIYPAEPRIVANLRRIGVL